MVGHCGLWCALLLCALACLLSRCGHDFESSGPHGRGSGPTCLTVRERTEEPTDSGIFPRGPPSLWVSHTSGVWACEAPVCVFSILLSPTWVHGADSLQQLSVNGRGSGPTCLTGWERTGEWTDFGVFPRGPPSLWVSYTPGVGACEAPVCVFSILSSRTWVHRPDSVQQLSVSGRGSGPTCLAVWDLNDFGVIPRGPPSLWVSYTFEFGVCESPVCIFYSERPRGAGFRSVYPAERWRENPARALARAGFSQHLECGIHRFESSPEGSFALIPRPVVRWAKTMP